MMDQNSLPICCLDQKYSTTRRVLQVSNPQSSENTMAQHGGLRMSGYGKTTSVDNPLITVIIPVLNGVNTLRDTIKSVINQTYSNVELIIIDGQSDDGSVDIIREYEQCVDYWISAPDKGAYDAMNKGVRLASGERVYFLGSDDILLDCFHIISSLMQDPLAIYYGDVLSSRKSKPVGGPFSLRRLIRKNIPHQAIFYPRSVFDNYSYDLRYKIAADYLLNVRCFTEGRYRFVYIPYRIAVFNDIDGLSSRYIDEAFSIDEQGIRKEYFPKITYYEYIFRELFRRIERKVKGIFGKSRHVKTHKYYPEGQAK